MIIKRVYGDINSIEKKMQDLLDDGFSFSTAFSHSGQIVGILTKTPKEV